LQQLTERNAKQEKVFGVAKDEIHKPASRQGNNILLLVVQQQQHASIM